MSRLSLGMGKSEGWDKSEKESLDAIACIYTRLIMLESKNTTPINHVWLERGAVQNLEDERVSLGFEWRGRSGQGELGPRGHDPSSSSPPACPAHDHRILSQLDSH